MVPLAGSFFIIRTNQVSTWFSCAALMLNCFSFNPAGIALRALCQGEYARYRRHILTVSGKTYPILILKLLPKFQAIAWWVMAATNRERDTDEQPSPVLSGPARFCSIVRSIVTWKSRILTKALLCSIPWMRKESTTGFPHWQQTALNL